MTQSEQSNEIKAPSDPIKRETDNIPNSEPTNNITSLYKRKTKSLKGMTEEEKNEYRKHQQKCWREHNKEKMKVYKQMYYQENKAYLIPYTVQYNKTKRCAKRLLKESIPADIIQ